MKKVQLLLLTGVIYLSSCSVLQNFALEPTSFETISALKEILNSSTFRAVSSLRKMQNGGAEAILPENMQSVLATMKNLGLGGEIDNVSKQIGTVSGLMVEESTGIIGDAIKEISFTDAVAVVLGGEDAATMVLKNAMYGSVKKRYSSRLETELAKTEALQYWPIASSAFNLFAEDKIDTSLPDFIAERAVDGLFLAMGKEESKIRKDPASLGKAVVTKVFDFYQNKKTQS